MAALVIWLAIALVLIVAEVLTLAFIGLYLAAGAIGAAIAGAAGANVVVQVLVFAAVSVLSLVLTRRPLMRALDRMPQVASNALTVVGKRGEITVTIPDGPAQRGLVRIGTEYWSACASDEHAIEAGATVEVTGIEGVTAHVVRVA